ncbi:hypothetical protein SPURM210S_05644 [Streptomyces purpurascens]
MFTTRPTLQGTFGMVSSTHWLASQSAMAVLEDGGNAYDAAVAGAFVLHVVEPHLNGPAGEVPILLAPAGGEVRVLCGQGVAPAGATVAHYRGLGLDLVPGTGPLAAAVPGAFDAWMMLLRDHGTKSLADVLKYAIGYAEHGHAPVERVGETVETVRELFETEWTSSADVYLPGGKAPRPGELFANPVLAATWKRLLGETAGAGDREARIEAARQVWRTGFIAEALVRQAARPTLDTSGTHHTGTLTAADLAAWSATYETPATYDWNGWTVCKPGPWSQGPVLLQQLAVLRPSCPGTARPTTSTSWSRAANSPWPTGRPGTGTPPTCRSTTCCPTGTTRPGVPSSASGPTTTCGPAAPADAPRGCAPTRAWRLPPRRASTPWAPANRPSPRARRPRCRANRRSSPTGPPGGTPATSTSSTAGPDVLGHAQRRLAPVQSRRARTGLPARHPAPDDLARGGPAGLPHPRPPPLAPP